MILLGIDPGAKTGWVTYDTETRRVVESGTSAGIDVVAEADTTDVELVVIERPRGYGPTYPQVVECGYVCGYVVASLTAEGHDVCELVRHDVTKILSDATRGAVRVKNDATAWAALVLLHGDGCDKKGGALHGVRAHERAALAVAVAWALREEVAK